MKLEVGMYVRTEKGKIDKIIGFDGALILFLYDLVYGYIDENDIIKASHNIIDLIEVGDYVDGCRVHKIANCITIILDNEENISWVKPSEIKSIVTKECFESMSYRISSEEITEIFWSKVNRQLDRIAKEEEC